MSGKPPPQPKSDSNRSSGSTTGSVRPWQAYTSKPHVTVTVLAYGTDLVREYPFTENQVIREDYVFIPKDATVEQMEEIVKRYVKVALPSYDGRYSTLCNPDDVKRILMEMFMLSLPPQPFNSAGSVVRMIGHVYVLLLDPSRDSHPRGDAAGRRDETAPLDTARGSKPPENNPESAPKRRRIDSPSKLDLTSLCLREEKSMQYSTSCNRASPHTPKNNQNRPVVDKTNSRKRKRGQEVDIVAQPMDLAETYFHFITTLSSTRRMKKAVRSLYMPCIHQLRRD